MKNQVRSLFETLSQHVKWVLMAKANSTCEIGTYGQGKQHMKWVLMAKVNSTCEIGTYVLGKQHM